MLPVFGCTSVANFLRSEGVSQSARLDYDGLILTKTDADSRTGLILIYESSLVGYGLLLSIFQENPVL